MKLHRASRLVLFLAVVAAGLLAGCSGRTADESLASAKGYLSKNDLPAAIIELKNALQAKPDSAEARFLLGKALLERRDPSGAAIELRRANELKYPPDSVVPLLAKALLRSGGSGKVIELDNVTVLTVPESIADFKTTVAQAQAIEGNTEKSSAAVAAALQAKPDHAPALLIRARDLASAGDTDAAMKIVDDVLRRAPNDAEALVLKGDVLRVVRKDPDAALEAYRQALRGNPDDPAAQTALIEQLLAKNDFEGARRELDAMKKSRPGNLQAIYFESRLAAQKGELDKAEELAQQLLKVAPDNLQALQLGGVIALRRNQLLLAEERLGKVVQGAPVSPVARQLLARAFVRDSQPAKALDVLEPLLQSESPDATTLALAGGASLTAGDLKKAEELFGRAAKLDPDDLHSRRGLAVAHLMSGEGERGLSDLQAIAGEDPGTRADMALISAYLARRDYDAALKAIDRLEKKSPGKPEGPQMRGRALAMRGDRVGARASYEKALAADPKFFPAIDGLAALDWAEGKPDAARARFEAVLKADPAEVQALVALANMDERAGKPKQEVAATLATAVSIKPTYPWLRRRLVQYHLSKKDYKLALNAAQDAVSALPNDVDMLALLAGTQLAAGENNQAITSYNKLASLRPRSPMPLLGLAEALTAAKSYDAAAEAVRKAARLAPDSPQVIQGAAAIDMRIDRPEEALALARSAQTRMPKAALGFAIEGELESSRRNWPAAVSAFRAALQREPAATGLAQRLYVALRSSGDGAKSEAFAGEWIKAHPDDAGFVFFLSGLSIADKKYPLAESQLQQVLRLTPDNPTAVNNLAWVLAAQKKPQALEMAERANRLVPNEPIFMDTLAIALAAQGQLPRALELQKKAVELDPNAPALRLTLAHLYIQSGDKASARKELDSLSKLGDKFPKQAEVRELLVQLP